MTNTTNGRRNFDPEARPTRYFRNAVERHWDPHEIDLEPDLEGFFAQIEDEEEPEEDEEERLEFFKQALALFGAGEQAVTEDLAPLAAVAEDPNDQMFLTSQLYDEAKHAEHFDRYWRRVVHTVEEFLGQEKTDPRDDRWFPEEYDELFERNQNAMYRLLEEDTPENRALAISHYHMTIEGIFAQTGYYSLQTAFGPDVPEDIAPNLPGLCEGFRLIRQDEGRHVGWGMAKLKGLVERGEVDPELITETVDELVPLVIAVVEPISRQANERTDHDISEYGLGPDYLADYAARKHRQRMEQITNVKEEIPDVNELTTLRD